MKKFLFIAILFSMTSTLWAQSYTLRSKNANWINDLEVLVKLDTQREDTLTGRDINSNGIRDDVEAYINRKFGKDLFQKVLFMEAAQKIQKIITLPEESSVEEHLALDRELLQLYTCRDYILYRDNEENIEQEMLNKTLFKAKVLNTQERLSAYIAHKKKLPFEFSDLTQDQLTIEKSECLSRYNAFKNPDTHASLVKGH